MYKYQQIANTIKKKINNQSYQPNQKLPSIVQLSKTYHCSKVTVLKSYELLCNQHLIYTKPQSGYYVANNPILEKQESQYYYLNNGNPIVSTTPLVDAKHCLSIAIDQYSKSFLNISLQRVESLYQLLPDFLKKYDIYTKTELIYLTQGITQMLSFLTLTNFNDKNGILIEEPTYSYYVQFLKTQNIPVYTILRHEDGIDLHQLELLFQKNKIKFFYVVPRNHNPLGTNLNTKTRQQIAQLALKYNVIIIEDDYFSHAFHTPHYLPIHYYMADQNCIYLTSFSKTIPHLRIGTCVIAPAFKPIFENLIHQSYYYSYQLPSLISQATLEAYLQNNLYEQ